MHGIAFPLEAMQSQALDTEMSGTGPFRLGGGGWGRSVINEMKDGILLC
jgi:hypothetical protein